LRLDSFTFAGAPLSIELSRRNGTPEISNDARELKGKITAMLTRRYNAELKLLDLSALGNDSEFANTGMFETHSRQAKFFPALMRVCDMMFSSHVQKKEAVLSVTLANNTLPNLATVTTLAETFPDLKNLDLSNNNFKDLAALSAWRWKFRSLDHLVLTGNPIETQVPNYQQDMLKWFPTLRSLNTVQVRSDAEIAEASKSKLPLPTLPASFRDEGQIAENFVKHFFSAYDSDRSTLANGFYDPESTFSLSVNISAPRAQDGNQSKAVPWDAYIKKSRNLIKITSLPARMSRSLKGVDNIRETWLDLPTTRHPDLFTESEKWCIECHSLPSLPDQSGQVLCGVGGLIIMAHGEFGEVDVSTGSITAMRSFDRTFILGPGAGIGGIRVVNDILVVRAYGGHEAWKSTEVSSIGVSSQIRLDGLVLPDEGFGVAIPGKPNEQLQKEVLAIELSKATRMTLEYSGMCLEQSGWNLENASKMFEEAKVGSSSHPEAMMLTYSRLIYLLLVFTEEICGGEGKRIGIHDRRGKGNW
jgi:nuclear RNA export factor